MKIVREAVLRDSKKIPVLIIGISIFMLVLSICNLSIDFAADTLLSFEFGGIWSAALSLLPITYGVSTAMLLKTKKLFFAKLPSYIICSIIGIVLILYYIAAGNNDIVINFLMFAIAVLLIYPFVVATLTIEGRMYNKVFANVFSALLLIISVIAAIVFCALLKSITFSFLIPALIYTELILTVNCFDLKKLSKATQTN